MTENFFHTILKKQIKKIAEESGKYKRINVEKNIPIPHPNMDLVIHYKPEVHLFTKTGKKIVFEILDDQLNDYNLILADIIQCYLVENVSKLFLISKNKEGAKLATKLSKILGSILQEKGFFKTDIPKVMVYTITYEELNSGNPYEILRKIAKEDGWG
jgi:hypothetical protein